MYVYDRVYNALMYTNEKKWIEKKIFCPAGESNPHKMKWITRRLSEHGYQGLMKHEGKIEVYISHEICPVKKKPFQWRKSRFSEENAVTVKKKPVSVKKKPLQWRKKPLFFSFTVYTQFFMAIHSNFFSLIFPSFSLTFLPFFAVGALVIYAKIPRKLKKAICSFFFLFFWSAQNFSYCSWLVLPSLGSKQLALEAFVMSRLRLDITKLASLANCLLPCEGKTSHSQ